MRFAAFASRPKLCGPGGAALRHGCRWRRRKTQGASSCSCAPSRGDRQVSGVPRRPHFEGREWGKPQARCSGRHSDDDPV